LWAVVIEGPLWRTPTPSRDSFHCAFKLSCAASILSQGPRCVIQGNVLNSFSFDLGWLRPEEGHEEQAGCPPEDDDENDGTSGLVEFDDPFDDALPEEATADEAAAKLDDRLLAITPDAAAAACPWKEGTPTVKGETDCATLCTCRAAVNIASNSAMEKLVCIIAQDGNE
jgi:hypothetical protein